MRNLLAAAIILFSSGSWANTVNHVWISSTGGNLELICKEIWNTYDNLHQTKTTFVIKPGADGLIAAKDFVASTLPNRFICTGSSVFVYNQFIYPDQVRIDPLIRVGYSPIVWYVPNTNTANSLRQLVDSLRALKRPVNVGVVNSQQKTLIQYFADHYKIPVNIVAHKTGGQWYPSIVDGSLDLAIDTGLGVNIAESGRFRIAGYAAPETFPGLNRYENFAVRAPQLTQISAWIGMGMPKDSDAATKREMSARLLNIMQQSDFRNFALPLYVIPVPTQGQQFEQSINSQIDTIRNIKQ